VAVIFTKDSILIATCQPCFKKCKKPDDVLFINASGPENFDKGKRQNQLRKQHITKIIDTYQFRKEEPRYSRRVDMDEIKKNDFNLNISRYISTAVGDKEISLKETNQTLVVIEKAIETATVKHNAFLKELDLPLLP
jgi:type I restriction enzyme M protein